MLGHSHSSLSAEFWKHYVFSGETQRRALSHNQRKEMEILNISFPRMGIEPTTCRVYSRMLVPLSNDWIFIFLVVLLHCKK